MPDEPEDLTLQILREMRDEIREFRSETNTRFSEIDERLETVEMQTLGISGMLTQIYGRLMDHDERIVALENLKTT